MFEPKAAPLAVESSTKGGLQVLGLCRFSVPSLGAFQVEHETIEERRAMLYDPERLDQRLLWFEHICLPAIVHQKDKSFRLVVMIGADLPDPWKDKLETLVRDVPQVIIEPCAPKHHRVICREVVQKHTDPSAQRIAQFRLDDDDAIAVDFIRHLRRDVRRAAALVREEPVAAFDYAKGILLWAKNKNVKAIPTLERLWTAGLVILTKPGDGNHILDFVHHTIWRQMQCVSSVADVMFVRGAHSINDSEVRQTAPAYDIPKDEIRQLMWQRFRIDLPEFSKLHKASLADRGVSQN